MGTFFRRRLTWRPLSLTVFETALILGIVAGSVYVRLGAEALRDTSEWPKWILIVAVTQLCLYFSDLYDSKVIVDRRQLFVRALYALSAASFVLALIYFWFPDLIVGRGVFMLAALSMVITVLGWRVAFEWMNRRVGPRERLLLVGTSAAAVSLAKELYDRSHLAVEIVGFVDPDPSRVGMPILNPGIIGTVEDIPTLARALSVDRVVVSLSDARGRLPMDKLLDMRLDGVTFDHLASVYEEYTGKIAIDNLRPSWLIFSPGFRKGRLLQVTKRTVDLLAAAVGLIVTSPLLVVIGMAVRLTSAGPALYRQQRVGQHGRLFTVYKFRSMRQDAEAGTGAVWATENDPRITPLGRFLRKSRLDELPQLWNVLRGDMSLVGPRPERPEFVASLTAQIPFYGQRHIIKPGLTGWAQVSYSYGDGIEGTLEKLQYDLFYIKNLSIPLDLFILFKTAKIVCLGRGAR